MPLKSEQVVEVTVEPVMTLADGSITTHLVRQELETTDEQPRMASSNKYCQKFQVVAWFFPLLLTLLLLNGCQYLPSSKQTTAQPEDPALSSVALPPIDNALLKQKIADNKGKVVIVNFWASWCGPCKEEAPLLEEAHQKYKDQGLVIIGIDIDDRAPAAKKFIMEYGLTYENNIDETGEIGDFYQIPGLPMSYFYNRKGEIAGKWLGGVSRKELDQILTSLL